MNKRLLVMFNFFAAGMLFNSAAYAIANNQHRFLAGDLVLMAANFLIGFIIFKRFYA